MMFRDIIQLIDDYGEMRISKEQFISQITFQDYLRYSGKIKKAEKYRELKLKYKDK